MTKSDAKTQTALTPNLIDEWATDANGPVALHMRQRLLAVEGEDGEDQVIYPPTYADIGYNIDTLADGTKVALIDSVGSQANRLEPAFKQESGHALANFVPQINIVLRVKDCGTCDVCTKEKRKKADKCENPWKEKRSLFDVAHRAADAVVRSCPTLSDAVKTAFARMHESGDAGPLAAIAPTSLVFGCWDSRGGTGEKRPRLVRSIVRAWDVDELHAASQFTSILKSLPDEDRANLKAEAAKKGKAELSVAGLDDAPATTYKDGRRILGGIVVRGAIDRHVTINLVALRGIVGADDKESDSLRKYLLALALLTASTDIDLFLREGCNLRIADAADDWKIVPRRGEKTSVELNNDGAQKVLTAYAKTAAKPFLDAWKKLDLGSDHAFDLKAAKALLGTSTEQG